MPLTPQQRSFLDTHISRVKRSKTARARTKEAEAYAQQRARVLAQLERLPADAPAYKHLEKELKAADKKAAVSADDLNFGEAAQQLAALAQANEVVVKDFDLTPHIAKFRQRIEDIERAGRAALSARPETRQAMDALKARAMPISPGLMPIPPRNGALWAATAQPLLQHYGAEVDAVENGAHQLAATLQPLNLFVSATAGLNLCVKWVDELMKAAHARNDNDARLQLFDLVQRLQFPQLHDLRIPGGPDQFISRAEFTLELDLARREVLAALQPLRDQLATLQADAGHEDAGQVNAERQHDAQTRATPKAPTGPRRPPAATFDLKGLMSGMPVIAGATLPGGSLNAEFAPDVSMLRSVGQQAQQALVAQLEAQGDDAHSEAFFDLSLMSAEELAAAFANGKGWGAEVMQPAHKAMAQAAGLALFNLVMKMKAERKNAQGHADGLSIDTAGGTLTLGDKQYGKPRELSRGALGAAIRYENLAQPGDYVVVKSTISDPKDRGASKNGRDAMKKEIVAHQRLMGAAADAPGRGNLAQMHGAVAAPDGTLHLVVEMIDGGDLDTNRLTDILATESGLLPEEARAVLNQARIKQAAEALKLMRDEGLVHFDVKDANFMLTADGTLKLIDFGAAGQVRDDGRASIPETVTEGFAPGRSSSAPTDSSFDTFALGKVMQLMHVNTSFAGRPANAGDMPPEFQRMTGALARIGEAMTSADESKRPTLEAVLASSYLKNLDNFDPAAVQALAAKTIEYGKALKAELATVLPRLPPNDVARWAASMRKTTDKLSLEEIVRCIKLDGEDLQIEIQAKRQQLEDLGPPPVPPVRGLAVNRSREDRKTAGLRRSLEAELIVLARQIPAQQEQLALLSKSPTVELAEEMQKLSQQMLRPSAPDVPTGPQPVNVFALNKLKRELGLRLPATDTLVKTAAQTQPPHANTHAATLRYQAAKVVLASDPKKAQVLLDQVEALLG